MRRGWPDPPGAPLHEQRPCIRRPGVCPTSRRSSREPVSAPDRRAARRPIALSRARTVRGPRMTVDSRRRPPPDFLASLACWSAQPTEGGWVLAWTRYRGRRGGGQGDGSLPGRSVPQHIGRSHHSCIAWAAQGYASPNESTVGGTKHGLSRYMALHLAVFLAVTWLLLLLSRNATSERFAHRGGRGERHRASPQLKTTFPPRPSDFPREFGRASGRCGDRGGSADGGSHPV